MDMGTTGWGAEDDDEEVKRVEDNRNLPITDLRTQQAQMLRGKRT